MTIPTDKSVRTLTELRSVFNSTWEAPLRLEGFGQSNIRDPHAPPDVSAEIESMLAYQKLVSFLRSSAYDIDNRARFLEDYVRGMFTVDSLARTIIPTRSFARKVVDNVAMLYRQNPERWLADETGALEADAAYQVMRRASKLDRAMKSAYRLAVATNLVLIRPQVVQRGGNGVPEYLTLTPNNSRVMLSDSGELEKVLYSAPYYDGGFKEYVVVVWTPTEHYILDVHGQRKSIPSNPDNVNPYGVVPFVMCQLDRADDDVYSGGAHDLVEACLRRNFLELLLTQDVTFAATGVWITENMELDKNGGVISPNMVYAFEDIRVQGEGQPASPKVTNVTGTPHSALIDELSQSLFKQTAIEHGISPAMLETSVREMSGRALEQMQRELLDRRLHDAEVMEDVERDLYVMSRRVWEVEARAGRLRDYTPLPEDPEMFHVDFGETTNSDLDEVQRFDLEMKQVEAGLISITDMYRRYNSDMDDDAEILDRIRENRAQMRRMSSGGLLRFLDGDRPADATAGGNAGNLAGAGSATDQNAANILNPDGAQ